MAWRFPPPPSYFDVQVSQDGTYRGCQLVIMDGDHVTFDYDGPARTRLRVQVTIESVQAILEAPPVPGLETIATADSPAQTSAPHSQGGHHDG